MNGPIENLMIVGGINGIYFAISLVMGLELAFDVFGLHKGKVSPMMRVGGLGMLIDAVSIFIGVFLYSIFPQAEWLDGISSVLDVITEIFFIYLGITLLSGRYPTTKQRLSALIPIFLSIVAAVIFPQFQSQGILLVDIILLLIFNHLGYRIYKRDKQLEHYYSNLDNLRSSWFLFYMIVVVFEMPLYYVMDIVNLWDVRGSMLYNVVMIALYLYLSRKLSTQEHGLTLEEIQGYEQEIEAIMDPIVEVFDANVTPETIAEDLAAEEAKTPSPEETVTTEPTEEGTEAVEEPKAEETVEEVKAEETAEEPKTEESEEKHAEKVDAYLTIGQQKAFAEKLRHLMEDERAYKNPDLTVEDLKSQLRTNAAYFYYFMHDVIKMRFYEYVNTYRVEAAKQLLSEQDYTMEYIALTTGFNSYNSFVRTFKKFTGVTPSKWVAQAA